MIEIIDLYKSFGANHVLAGVNLKIETGETMVVIGRSGAGIDELRKKATKKFFPMQHSSGFRGSTRFI